MEILLKYFPDLTREQQEKYRQLDDLYSGWNQKINLISRRDASHLFERHVLHSLSIARVIRFRENTQILDAGTGGGFPGIPLAIFFPEVRFTLVDSIGKKIKAVNDIIHSLELVNATAIQSRAEELNGKWHFVTSRAVAPLPRFYHWIDGLISGEQFNTLPNGILYLKGGNIEGEISTFSERTRVFDIARFFSEEFFCTKKIIHIAVPAKKK